MLNYILTPPVAFILVLVIVGIFSYLCSRLAYKDKESSGLPYACGEDTYNEYAQPDYSQFFPFAFFFTIAHVATLVLATFYFIDVSAVIIALIYISAVVVGLFILLWR